jgi:hypothetical protein
MFMDPMPLALRKRARSEADAVAGGCDEAAMTRDDAMRRPRPAAASVTTRRPARRGAVPVSFLALLRARWWVDFF